VSDAGPLGLLIFYLHLFNYDVTKQNAVWAFGSGELIMATSGQSTTQVTVTITVPSEQTSSDQHPEQSGVLNQTLFVVIGSGSVNSHFDITSPDLTMNAPTKKFTKIILHLMLHPEAQVLSSIL